MRSRPLLPILPPVGPFEPQRVEMSNLRDYYRITFPVGGRPWLLLDDRIFPVLDCSERGLRILADEPLRPAVDEAVRGKVRFPTGEEQEVTGWVLRHTPDGAALSLTGRGIHFGTILRLQLFVRRCIRAAREAAAPDAPPPAIRRGR